MRMTDEQVSAERQAVLRRMYDVCSTDEREAFVPRCLWTGPMC
jgi:hypothetical protein